jgi:prepilin-type N-terminal cleavage/methylation domain-containing protein
MLQGGVKPACSKGFTLAEVLITLAIVGVVAALTIPSLINKCQKIVWAKQAQENYAILTQAFKRFLADNDTTSFSNTELWGKIVRNLDIETYANYYSSDEFFWTEFGKYMKFSVVFLDGGKDGSYDIVLPNGTTFPDFWISPNGDDTADYKTDEECKKIKALGGNMCSWIGDIRIDINGDKGPNTYGRDRFFFYLSDEGVFYPLGGKDAALYYNQTDLATNSDYWKNYYNGTKEENAKKDQSYRTGQLVEEGWKMNY